MITHFLRKSYYDNQNIFFFWYFSLTYVFLFQINGDSLEELDHWNPLEDDFKSAQVNISTSINVEYQYCCDLKLFWVLQLDSFETCALQNNLQCVIWLTMVTLKLIQSFDCRTTLTIVRTTWRTWTRISRRANPWTRFASSSDRQENVTVA